MKSPDEHDVSGGTLTYNITNDKYGNLLNGEKKYLFMLLSDKPVCKYWSVIVYDAKTNMMISTDQLWPSVYSSYKGLVVNQDGSVHIWFGPKSPAEKENNWIKTIRRKGWYMILRLYEPLPKLLNIKWKPGEIEEVK
jgi:hypothetical protein